jgi:hypothetical protein
MNLTDWQVNTTSMIMVVAPEGAKQTGCFVYCRILAHNIAKCWNAARIWTKYLVNLSHLRYRGVYVFDTGY